MLEHFYYVKKLVIHSFGMNFETKFLKIQNKRIIKIIILFKKSLLSTKCAPVPMVGHGIQNLTGHSTF